jgi:hypothetical protein
MSRIQVRAKVNQHPRPKKKAKFGDKNRASDVERSRCCPKSSGIGESHRSPLFGITRCQRSCRQEAANQKIVVLENRGLVAFPF